MSKSKVSKVSKSREKILFISHATKDKKLITSFVEMLYSIGLKKENIFCSSIPELGVPIKEDIYDYLRNNPSLQENRNTAGFLVFPSLGRRAWRVNA